MMSISMNLMTLRNVSNKSWLHVIMTAVLFYAAGQLTLPLSLPPSYATAIWPPAGIGLAAVLLWGNRVLPGIFMAELFIHFEVYNLSTLLVSPTEALIFFLNPVNSAIRAWLGSLLVKKFAGFPNELISTRLIARFFLLAGPVATFLPAVLSVYLLFLNGVIIEADLVFSFLTWWMGDCTGIAVFTPLFFIVFNRSHRIWQQRRLSLGLPMCVMFVAVAASYLFTQQYEVKRLHKVIEHQVNSIRIDLQNEFQNHLSKDIDIEGIDIKSLVAEAGIKKNFEHVVIKLFNNNVGVKQIIFQSDGDPELFDPLGLSTSTTVTFDDHQWLLEVAPDSKFLSEHYSWSVWQLLAGGMFLTGFMSIGLLVLTGHTELVRFEVDKCTGELRKSNKQLAESEQQFKKLVQTQSAIVWRADPVSCRFLFVSDEAESILGYPVDSWVNDPDFWVRHLHEDDRDTVPAFCAEETREHRNHEIEYRMIAADGRCVWLRDIVNLTIENNEVTDLFGFMIDITKQKQAEEQLRLAATTFESQQGIIITDKNAKILRVNKAFTEITGFSEEQVIGKNPSILKSGHQDQAFYQNFWKQLTTRGKFEGEVWNRRKNGEFYPQWQTVMAVKNERGEVSHYLSVFADITEKKNVENKVNAMAFYDPLTNLPNRRLLLDRFEQELAVARRHGQFGAAIYLDLDHFKWLNDSQGHLIGDELLIQVGHRLNSVLRDEDTPARLGGDEFVVLLHANSDSLTAAADQALIVAEKIRVKLNEPFMLNHYRHQISPSIGITLFPENQEAPDIILQQADMAMYRSKSSGRNAISFFHPSMQEAADMRLILEKDIRTAVDQGRFVLCYQSQVDCDGVLLSAEALIRWEHQDKGTLSPVDFIPVAEESSLIVDIGQWVLMEACSQIKAWQDAGVAIPRISVNVSSRQFKQKDFVDQVKYAIESSGIAPYQLGVELTENVMIVDIDDTVFKMKALKALGISITVDDFGTGYSSLANLKQLPIDGLQIDYDFVRDILIDANDAVIVETIIGMAKNLGLHVIAKGIETVEQLELLKRQGCPAFQGYYFSKPLSAQQFIEKYF